MEKNGYNPEEHKEKPTFFEEYVALEGLVDVLFEKSDEETFRWLHMIANLSTEKD